jgi:glycosyltransferase involved in cell wall biosynthesis
MFRPQTLARGSVTRQAVTSLATCQGDTVLITRVVAKLEPGGAQLSLLRITRALGRRGHRTRLLAGNATPAGLELARAHGLEVEVMGSDLDLQWRCDPTFAAWLAPRLAEADLVHAHMLGAWWAAATAAPESVPLVASEHNGYEWKGEAPWRAMSDVAKRVDRFFAHGPGARAGAGRVGIAGSRIRTGISPVQGTAARPRPGLPTPRIVFTGRLSPDKGPDILLEAVAQMTAPPPVLMVGAGVMQDALSAQVVRLGLEAVVSFCGWVSDTGPWVAGATVQVCPSRDESFSQTAVLAMGLGVPVIGTRVDGFPDTLADGRGILVAPEDPAALARALKGLLAGELRTDTKAARRWSAQFSVNRVADVYEREYAELLRPVHPAIHPAAIKITAVEPEAIEPEAA